MLIKEEKGVTGIDLAISIIIITIFIAMVGNLIININLNSKDTQRKTIATSYAMQEIEKIKAKGYIDSYNEKGINQEDTIEEDDIIDSNNNFTGYHKKVSIKDYVLIQEDNTKKANLVKKITVEISYKLKNNDKSVSISTYVAYTD